MRAIFTGIEYAGKTTLIDLLGSYYEARGLPAHYDDHFSLPDRTLSEESRKLLLDAPDDMKERYQRMQIQFHIELIEFIQNPLFGGWFIEEAVYCDIYGEDPDSPYYRRYRHIKQRVYEAQIFERRLPDVVLFHLAADDDTIRPADARSSARAPGDPRAGHRSHQGALRGRSGELPVPEGRPRRHHRHHRPHARAVARRDPAQVRADGHLRRAGPPRAVRTRRQTAGRLPPRRPHPRPGVNPNLPTSIDLALYSHPDVRTGTIPPDNPPK